MVESAPLSGIRVLDVGHYLAGPWCAGILARLGAEVTKVERPEGDPQRRTAPWVVSPDGSEGNPSFRYVNTDKRGITLNLKTRTGKALFLEMVGNADIVVDNFSPRVLPRLGLGFEVLRQRNPAIIVTSITNFGQTGPYRDYRASELVLYAAGGLMSISGLLDQEPLKHGLFTQAQFAAGTMAAFATLTALAARRRSGQGEWVDVSIMETLASELVANHSYYAYLGAVQSRQRRPEVNIDGRVGLIPAADGCTHPSLGVSDGAVSWESMTSMLEAPDLNQPRFHTHSTRIRHTDDLVAAMKSAVQDKPKRALFDEANTWRFPWGCSQKMDELLDCPQLDARNFYATAPYGSVAQLPFRSSAPWTVQRVPAPDLGQHNADVYCDGLGLGRNELLALRAQGVI